MITEDSVASDEVQIQAPAALVWQILVDFDNYSEWNRFCPQIRTRLELGAPVDMMIDLGFGPQQQVEYMTLIEPGRVLAWGMKNEPGDPIHAERTQRLSPLTDSSCSYVSIDDFAGDAAPEMLRAMGEAIERGFNLCAYGLKERAEALHRDATSVD